MKILRETIRKLLIETIQGKLFHATYSPLEDSIMRYGLGGDRETVYEDSVRGVVYLATDPNIAASYAEVGLDYDHIWDKYKDSDIIVFEIDTSLLDHQKLMLDKNVIDNTGETLEYHGIIPPEALKVVDRFTP